MADAATELAPAAATPLLWHEVRAIVSAAQPRFTELDRLTQSARAGDPASFASDLLRRLRERVAMDGGDDFALDTALAQAAATRPHATLFPILRALIAREAGNARAALRHARAAAAINSRPLFPQRLVADLEGRSPDEDLAGRFCPMPWETFETHPDGAAHFCCPTWLPAPIGNLHDATPEALWNGPAAQDVRRSILDGSFRYCSRVWCPRIANRTLEQRGALSDPVHRRIVARGEVVTESRPRYAVLSHDRSCNLSCPSCRRQRIVARKDEQARLDGLLHTTLMPLLRQARRVTVTGSGDPFASTHFRDVLRTLSALPEPRPRVTLHTNGLLLDARAWAELGLEGLADQALISIDAARPETYRLVRRGGELDRLLANLAFVADLRRRGSLRRVRLDAVVQAANLGELAAIVRIAREFGFDGVKFQMLRNWGTWSAAAFAREHVGAPEHPRYPELREALRNPLLAGSDIEFFGMSDVLRDAGHPAGAPSLRAQAKAAS